MINLSVAETEELATAIGVSIRDQYGPMINTEKNMKKMIEFEMREIIKKSFGRTAPWLKKDADPMNILKIEKAMYTHAGDNEVLKKVQDWNDDVYLLTKALNTSPDGLKSFAEYQAQWSELAKALNAGTAGEGLEWAPTGFSQQLIEMVEIEAVVASKFNNFTMPRSPYTFPLLLGDGEAYLGGLDTGSDEPDMYKASTPTTDDLTFTAVPIISRYVVTEVMEEESVIPVLPLLKRSIARAHAKAKDNAIINGDVSTIHQDTGRACPAEDARRAWIGLRKLTIAAQKQSGSSWTGSTGLGLVRALRTGMGIYGLKSADLMLLANVQMIGKFKSIDQVVTVQNTGMVATILNGEIEKLDGVGIVPTQHMEENQNASGIYDGITTNTLQFMLVYKPGFWMGNRRNFRVEFVRKPERGVNYLVATSRAHWKSIRNVVTEKLTGWSYAVPK